MLGNRKDLALLDKVGKCRTANIQSPRIIGRPAHGVLARKLVPRRRPAPRVPDHRKVLQFATDRVCDVHIPVVIRTREGNVRFEVKRGAHRFARVLGDVYEMKGRLTARKPELACRTLGERTQAHGAGYATSRRQATTNNRTSTMTPMPPTNAKLVIRCLWISMRLRIVGTWANGSAPASATTSAVPRIVASVALRKNAVPRPAAIASTMPRNINANRSGWIGSSGTRAGLIRT